MNLLSRGIGRERLSRYSPERCLAALRTRLCTAHLSDDRTLPTRTAKYLYVAVSGVPESAADERGYVRGNGLE